MLQLHFTLNASDNTSVGKSTSDATSANSGKDESKPPPKYDTESLFDAVNSKDALQVFRELLSSDKIKDVNMVALELI